MLHHFSLNWLLEPSKQKLLQIASRFGRNVNKTCSKDSITHMHNNGKSAGTTVWSDDWETYTDVCEFHPYSNSEIALEWETHKTSHYGYPYFHYELENEEELFFGDRLQRFGSKVSRVAVPLARSLAPIAARTLVGAAPGVGGVAGSGVGRLFSTLLEEGEMVAQEMEAEFFGFHAREAEVADTEAAREAALTEVLAAEASHSSSLSEAQALMGTALPIVLRSMRIRRLLHIMPTLVQANARLVHLLHRQGTAGRQLQRLLPTILRWTVASLRVASTVSYPINSALARRVMAAQVLRVLSNSQIVKRTMIRNAIIRERTVALARPR